MCFFDVVDVALFVASSTRLLFVIGACVCGTGGEALLTPRFAMGPLLRPTKRRDLLNAPPPPPPKKPRLPTAPAKSFCWSQRMTSPSCECLPFTKVVEVSRSSRSLLVSKARPPVRSAMDGPGEAPFNRSFSPDPSAPRSNASRVNPVVAVTLEWGVKLMKLLDKDEKDCVDFATMLKFFELFGWGPEKQQDKHELWVEDWHAILQFLGGLDHHTSSLRCDEFIQLISRPGGPPLIAGYTVEELVKHVESSYLGEEIVTLPPNVPWLEREAEFPKHYITNAPGEPLSETLKRIVDVWPETRETLDPNGCFFLAWYYKCFGNILNEWYERNHKRQGCLAGREAQIAPEPVVVAAEPSGWHEKAYERFQACWISYEGDRYLFVNVWDWSPSDLKGVRYLVESPIRMGLCYDFSPSLHFTDGSDLDAMPDVLCLCDFRGLKTMVQGSNKLSRKRGIWAAIYLHHLIRDPESRERMTSDHKFDRKMMELLVTILENPAEVDLEADTVMNLSS